MQFKVIYALHILHAKGLFGTTSYMQLPKNNVSALFNGFLTEKLYHIICKFERGVRRFLRYPKG